MSLSAVVKMRPAIPFEDAIRHRINPQPQTPPVRLENAGPKQTTVSTPIEVGRDTVVTPSITVTPPDLKPNGQGGSIDGADISINARRRTQGSWQQSIIRKKVRHRASPPQ
jgi:hypothetical protein